MPHRSQTSSIGENPLDPNYLAPHYREEYRLAIDALIENDTQVTLQFCFLIFICVLLCVFGINSYFKYFNYMYTFF